MTTVAIAPERFDPLIELQSHQSGLPMGRYGASAVFIGFLRDFNRDAAVESMTLEYYPGMTEKQLRRIADDARANWEVLDVLVVHRVGDIGAGEPIVLTAAWAAHRDAAFGACRELIERLKTEAPFWKKERLAEGERWVEEQGKG